ncbi:MAG: tetratricopeptide repeat protein [Planctomycetota bacterium]|nr:MAG: tetratricopeptide repeat protein [Planctomycetota bacterium]
MAEKPEQAKAKDERADVSRTPASRLLVSSAGERVVVERTYKPGELIANRYKVDHILGTGGMGTVYLVADPGRPDSPVALKLVTGERNPVRLETFRNEFRILTRLDHENLIRVFDFGVLPEGDGFYYTAEHIDGQDLMEATENVTEDTLTDYIVQICRGLEYVHTRGYIHFDVKPRNILTTADGIVKLMDFGLSALSGRALGKRVRGTPAYTAPEIITQANVDERADLYSLGMTIFEIAARERPFSGLDTHQLLFAHVTAPPPPLSSVKPDAPKYLEPIIRRLLAKNPADRFDSANSVIQAIADARGISIELQPAASVEGYLRTPPLRGRDKELILLRDALDSLADGRGGHIHIEGPTGIGRTRLLREIHFEAQLRGFSAGFGSSVNPEMFEKLAGELSLTPGVDVPLPAEESEDSAESRRKESGKTLPEAAARIITIAEQAPVVMTVDDLQSPTVPNREALKLLAQMLSTSDAPPLLLITASRDTDEANSIAGPKTTRVPLAPLTQEEIGEVVTGMFSRIPAPEAFVSRLAEATGGTPKAVVETIRMLVGSGDIVVLEGKWRFRGGVEPFAIAPSLDEFYSAQAESLKGPALEFALYLALLDRPAGMTEVTAISGENAQDIADTLGELDRLGILHRVAGRVMIANPGIRNVLVASCTEGELNRRHRHLAEKLESIRDRGPTNLEIAKHFLLCGQTRKGMKYGLAGIEEGEAEKDKIRAVPILENLRRALPERYGNARAKVLYTLAHTRDNESDPEGAIEIFHEYREISARKESRTRRVKMERQAARMHKMLNQHDKFNEALMRAIELARPGTEEHLRSIADYEHALEYQGRLEDSEKLLLDTVKRFGRKKNVGMVVVYSALARLFMRQNQFKTAAKYIEKAINLGSEIGEDTEVEYMTLLAIERYLNNDIEGALEKFNRACKAAIDQNRTYMLAMLDHDAAAMLFELHRYQEGFNLATEAEGIWRRYADFRSLTHLYTLIASLTWNWKGCRKALIYLDKGRECARISDAKLIEFYLLVRKTDNLYRLGEFEKCLECAEETINFRDSHKIPMKGRSEITAGLSYAMSGDCEKGLSFMRKGLQTTSEDDDAVNLKRSWVSSGALISGDINLSYEQLNLIESTSTSDTPQSRFDRYANLGDFWHELGQFERTEEMLQKISELPVVNEVDLFRGRISPLSAYLALNFGRYEEVEKILQSARHLVGPDIYFADYIECFMIQVELELARRSLKAATKYMEELDSAIAELPCEPVFYRLWERHLRARLELMKGNRRKSYRIASDALQKAKGAGYRILQLKLSHHVVLTTNDPDESGRLSSEIETLADEFAKPFEEPLGSSVREYFLSPPDDKPLVRN